MMKRIMCKLVGMYFAVITSFRHIDGIAALALRLFLGPVFIFAGWKKITGIENTIQWFGNPDWGLGLPFPEFMGWAAALIEFGGGIALLLGLAVRLVSIPLMVTMLVAIFAVHIPNGWQTISDKNWIYANERVVEASERLTAARNILKRHGNYEWLTERGSIVINNNGIEFGTTLFVMLLALLFLGGGRYVSIDYWIARYLGRVQHSYSS